MLWCTRELARRRRSRLRALSADPCTAWEASLEDPAGPPKQQILETFPMALQNTKRCTLWANQKFLRGGGGVGGGQAEFVFFHKPRRAMHPAVWTGRSQQLPPARAMGARAAGTARRSGHARLLSAAAFLFSRRCDRLFLGRGALVPLALVAALSLQAEPAIRRPALRPADARAAAPRVGACPGQLAGPGPCGLPAGWGATVGASPGSTGPVRTLGGRLPAVVRLRGGGRSGGRGGGRRSPGAASAAAGAGHSAAALTSRSGTAEARDDAADQEGGGGGGGGGSYSDEAMTDAGESGQADEQTEASRDSASDYEDHEEDPGTEHEDSTQRGTGGMNMQSLHHLLREVAARRVHLRSSNSSGEDDARHLALMDDQEAMQGMLEELSGIEDMEDVYADDSERVDEDGMPLNRLASLHTRERKTATLCSANASTAATTASAAAASSSANDTSLAGSPAGNHSAAHLSSPNGAVRDAPCAPRGCRHYSRGCLLVAPCCGGRCCQSVQCVCVFAQRERE